MSESEADRAARLAADVAASGPIAIGGKTYYVLTAIREGNPGKFYLHYAGCRDGKPYGATRIASASAKPGTVGRAIFDAVKQSEPA